METRWDGEKGGGGAASPGSEGSQRRTGGGGDGGGGGATPWKLRARDAVRCPPHGCLARLATTVLAVLLLWAVPLSVLGADVLPGGNVFGLLLLFLGSTLAGALLARVRLPGVPPIPPLLGMLLTGFALKNVPGQLVDGIAQEWSSALRRAALTVILMRAGLGLDPQALRRLKGVCVRLSVLPCLVEAVSVGVVAHFLLHLPWVWGFMLGCVLGAVSPAVVVPSMLALQERGLGTEQGIPTLLLAAGSVDDVLAITGFNACLSSAFSTGSLLFTVLRGPLEIVMGVFSGLALGLVLRFFPSPDQAHVVAWRTTLLLATGVLAIFGSEALGFPGAGGLCCLMVPFVAARGWGDTNEAVAEAVKAVWIGVFQPLLFSLIGAEVSLSVLEPHTTGLCVGVLLVGLLMRLLVTFGAVGCAGLNVREKLFVSLAWLPKATVQAAIGSVALDVARLRGDTGAQAWGLQILTAAFLSILLTAPLGSLLIGLTGPRLLQLPRQPPAPPIPAPPPPPPHAADAGTEADGQTLSPDKAEMESTIEEQQTLISPRLGRRQNGEL
ncbi:sodium/hydrogen exchanger 9B2-like isoform X1 [Lethenteron reissneri]|uniref:sodium/hydrogen exchanger 9B2-like isoform X1 n=1 Tax=Lethenteron reissneri TaxID=7753 RepID=UPI002AB60E49|nr:sodium/hydrogen exchanger 9B2-like isoform X1 [Lethenteron reissneri]